MQHVGDDEKDTENHETVGHPGRDSIEATMTEATRGVTVRDFLIFQLKLLIDSGKDLVLLNASVVALILDLLSGGGRRPRLFYSVLRLSERFDLWLNLHGPATEAGDTDDGLFGASKAGSDTLLGKLEQMVRGGDEPRRRGGVHGGARRAA